MDLKIINKLTEQFINHKMYWDANVTYMTNEGLVTKSKIDAVPDDVWTYAKRCVSENDEILIIWFNSNIPGFYGEKPIEILELYDGLDVLKELMLKLPC